MYLIRIVAIAVSHMLIGTQDASKHSNLGGFNLVPLEMRKKQLLLVSRAFTSPGFGVARV